MHSLRLSQQKNTRARKQKESGTLPAIPKRRKASFRKLSSKEQNFAIK